MRAVEIKKSYDLWRQCNRWKAYPTEFYENLRLHVYGVRG